VSFISRRAYIDPPPSNRRYQRIDLTFAVADLAADEYYATVVSTEGEVWELIVRPFDKPSEYHKPNRPGYSLWERNIVLGDAAKGCGSPAKSPRALQALALADGGLEMNMYLAGCVTDDDRVHVWAPNGRVPQRAHLASCGTPIAGWTEEVTASTDVLPELRQAVLGREDLIVALTRGGGVWIAAFYLVDGGRRNPVLSPNLSPVAGGKFNVCSLTADPSSQQPGGVPHRLRRLVRGCRGGVQSEVGHSVWRT
jgi:hypothetical protein